MPKEIRMIVFKTDTPSDLKRVALGQSPTDAEGNIFHINPEVIVDGIQHKETGLAGCYRNKMSACYRISLSDGTDLIIPADNIRVLARAEGAKIGG